MEPLRKHGASLLAGCARTGAEEPLPCTARSHDRPCVALGAVLGESFVAGGLGFKTSRHQLRACSGCPLPVLHLLGTHRHSFHGLEDGPGHL